MIYIDDAELKRIGNMTPFSIAIEIADLRKELNIAKNNEVESKVSLSFELNNVKVLQAQLRTAESHKKTAMELCDGRATKINALESNLMEARKQLDDCRNEKINLRNTLKEENNRISNLRSAYDKLLERFNTREEDLFREQKRADENYRCSGEDIKIIVKQKGRIAELETELRKVDDLVFMIRNNNDHLNKVIERQLGEIETLKSEVEDLKKGVYRDGGCAGCNYWETRHKKLEAENAKLIEWEQNARNTMLESCAKHEQCETRIGQLEASIAIMDKKADEKDVLISGLEMDLRIATNDAKMWKQHYAGTEKHVEEWKNKHSELMNNSQIAFAKVNDLKANVESFESILKLATDALEATNIDRDTWRNSYGKCEEARKALLDKVMEYETEIGRLSNFEPLTQDEVIELERLRVELVAQSDAMQYLEAKCERLETAYKIIDKDNNALTEQYDKITTAVSNFIKEVE